MKRILIRDCQTNHFLDRSGQWTNSEEQAQNFPTTLNAIVHVVQKEIPHAQLLVRFGGSSPDVVLRVSDEHVQTAKEFARPQQGG